MGLLPAATYTLTVSGLGDTTGNFEFKLLDLSSATPIIAGTSAGPTGQAVSDTITPIDSIRLYQFAANAGDSLLFRTLSHSGDLAKWQLIDPYDKILFEGYVDGDYGSLAIPATGTYTLVITSLGNSTPPSYSFEVDFQSHTNPPEVVGTPLTVGTPVSDTIPSAGYANYLFTLAGPTRLWFDTLTTDPNLSWIVTGPAGIAGSESFSSGDRDLVLLPAGSYVLQITGLVGDPFAFNVLDFADATTVTPGTPVSTVFDPANSTQLYKFTGTAGSTIFLDNSFSGVDEQGNAASWMLIDPFGNTLNFGGLTNDSGRIKLPSSGIYTLVLQGDFGATGTTNATFNVRPVTDVTASLTLGTPVSSSIAIPNQQRIYTFTLASPTRLWFDSQVSSSNLSWSLSTSQWTIISNARFSWDDRNLGLLPAATYTLTVAGNGDVTGDFRFNLVDLAAATPITLGSSVTGSLSPASSSAFYRFSGTAGSSVYVDALSFDTNDPSGNRAYWTLLDPYSNLIAVGYSISDLGRVTLPSTGSYTFIVKGEIGASGTATFGFNIRAVTDNVTQLWGTSGNDDFLVRFLNATTRDIYLNGVIIGTLTGTTPLTVDGKGGTDTLTVIGTSSADTFSINASQISLGGVTTSLVGIGYRTVDGAGGDDVFNYSGVNPQLYLMGGSGVDTFKPAASTNVFSLDGGLDGALFDASASEVGLVLDLAGKLITRVTTFANINSVIGSTRSDAPVGKNNTVTTLEDTPYTFAISDFGFTDPGDLPANSLLNVRIMTLPAPGSLTNNGVPVAVGSYIPAADIAAGKFKYTPAANGAADLYSSFTFRIQDDGSTANGGVNIDPTSRVMYVNVTPVNDAPVGTAKTVTMLEDTTYTFKVSDFGFADPNDVPPNNTGYFDLDDWLLNDFGSIVVSNLPTSPGLTLNGSPLSSGQVITTADIAAGKLTFTPPHNASGGSYIKFSFQVRDNDGTANGGVDTDPIPRSMYVTVTPVNDAPVGTPKSVTILEDSSYTFGVNDFGFSDPDDSPANAFGYIVVSNLPTSPGLTLNGSPITAGQVITTIDIAAGKLKYTPPANANGAASIKFSFQVRDNGGTANGGINTDPTPKTFTVNVTSVNDAPVGTAKTVTMLEDSTYTFTIADFGFSDPNDNPANAFGYIVVSNLPTTPGLTLGGAPLTNGQVITTYDLAAGKLKYTPPANASGGSYIKFSFQVRDNGGTANGGVNTDPIPRSMYVTVTPVNDAPLGTSKSVSIAQGSSYTFGVNDFGFSDPNDSPANAFGYIVVSNLPTTPGLTLNGTPLTAGQVITTYDIAAGKLKYTSQANANGAASIKFSFQVRDNGGTANGGINTDPSPKVLTVNITPANNVHANALETSSIASASTFAVLDVTDQNSRPVGHHKSITILEDTSYTFSVDDFGFTDPYDSPPNNFAAVLITVVRPNSPVTLDGTPIFVGQVISTVDIAAGKLKFTPPANANGFSYAGFYFRVRDDGGTANGGQDTDNNQTTDININVTPVNDAPVGTAKTVTTLEDTPYTFKVADFGFSDPTDFQANHFASIIVSNLPTTPGLTFNGAPLTSGQVITAADIAAGKLKFTPPANANGGSYIKFSFQVRDDGGTANGGVDTDPTPRSMYVTVTAVNDAPIGTARTVTTLEDTPYIFKVTDFGFSDPVDHNAFGYIVVSNLPTSPGLTYNGSPLASGQVITTVDIAANKLKYTPPANANGAAYFKFSFQVRDNGGTANGGVNTDPVPRSMYVNVTSVNDAPVGTAKTVTTLEDTPYTFKVTDFGFSDPVEHNAFGYIVVSNLPTSPGLTFNGSPLTSGQVITTIDIAAGKLKYTPPANTNGAASIKFSFQVRDNGGTANGGVNTDPVPRSMYVNVTSVNDAPVGTAKTVTVLRGSTYTFKVTDFGFSDPKDFPANAFGYIVVSNLPNEPGLIFDGGPVFSGMVITTIDIAAGKLKFTPRANASGAASIKFSFQVRDNGGTANGGINTDPTPKAFTVNVTPVNNPSANTLTTG
ncbi:Ig-like domain-containing protein [Singulisphaera rosea]